MENFELSTEGCTVAAQVPEGSRSKEQLRDGLATHQELLIDPTGPTQCEAQGRGRGPPESCQQLEWPELRAGGEPRHSVPNSRYPHTGTQQGPGSPAPSKPRCCTQRGLSEPQLELAAPPERTV